MHLQEDIELADGLVHAVQKLAPAQLHPLAKRAGARRLAAEPGRAAGFVLRLQPLPQLVRHAALVRTDYVPASSQARLRTPPNMTTGADTEGETLAAYRMAVLLE